MRSFPVKYISVVEKLDEGAYHKKHMVQVTISPPQAEPEMLYLEAAVSVVSVVHENCVLQ